MRTVWLELRIFPVKILQNVKFPLSIFRTSVNCGRQDRVCTPHFLRVRFYVSCHRQATVEGFQVKLLQVVCLVVATGTCY